MQYLMAVYGPAELTEFGSYPDKASMEQAYADTGAFNEKLQAGGHFVFGNGLASATTATVVDGTGETPILTDGPTWSRRNTSAASGSIEAQRSRPRRSRSRRRAPRRAAARSRCGRSNRCSDAGARRDHPGPP